MNLIWSHGQLLLMAWLYAAACMFIAWLIFLKIKLPSIVDAFWSLVIMGVGLLYLSQSSWTLKHQVIAAMLILWALRLSVFIFWTRIRKKEPDPRYDQLLSGWQRKSLGYFINYQFQAVLGLIIATPFYFIILSDATFQWVEYIALALFVIGLSLEALADWQLYAFKKKPTGPVCNKGLWAWSRHPNYFFEWLIWLSFALFALPLKLGFIGLVSPLLLLYIMLKITGPITEQGSLKSRGEAYIQYQAKTSIFVPWPPKK